MNLFNYNFSDEQLIETALTHSSYANEHSGVCNERMEFLGDSVLSLAVSRYIYEKFPYLPEGRLSKIRASVVCEKTLAKCAEKLNFGNYIKLGRGEEASGGKYRHSILSDAFESVIAAIYLDGGFESARKWIIPQLAAEIDKASKYDNFHDYKTMLQEISQSKGLGVPEYIPAGETGPDHAKVFTMRLRIGKHCVTGEGKSKKAAETNAAKKLLESFGEI